MANHRTTDQLAQGDVIVERFAGAPAGVKKLLGPFKAAHVALAKSGAAAATAKATRDAALAAVGEADDALDVAVGDLADALVGAKMAPRKNAFTGFSAHPPSAVTTMAYASEVKEVLAICAKVTKQRPPADVAKAAAACVKLAGGVTKALGALSKPQLAYASALAARDALLPGWTKALTTLKRKALAELDDAGAAKALFAPPERVQDPKKKRPAKKKAAAPAASPAAPATPPPAVSPPVKPAS